MVKRTNHVVPPTSTFFMSSISPSSTQFKDASSCSPLARPTPAKTWQATLKSFSNINIDLSAIIIVDLFLIVDTREIIVALLLACVELLLCCMRTCLSSNLTTEKLKKKKSANQATSSPQELVAPAAPPTSKHSATRRRRWATGDSTAIISSGQRLARGLADWCDKCCFTFIFLRLPLVFFNSFFNFNCLCSVWNVAAPLLKKKAAPAAARWLLCRSWIL